MSTDSDTPTPWTLRATIRSVVNETDLASPAEIAAKVGENIDDDLLREALGQALPDLVRMELSRIRMRLPVPTPATGNGSAKVRAIRSAADGWRQALRERINTGPNEWMLLADCGVDQFRYAAEQRRTHAERALASAGRFDALAEACEKHRAARAAELPNAVLAALLGGEVAAA